MSAASGARQLNDGAGQLIDGLKTSQDGVGKLASGAGDLYDGMKSLDDGAASLVDGNKQVIEDRSSMMSQPVEVDTDKMTTVANYGTGFAPYFIALGLWVGALMTTFLMKPLNNRLIASGASPVIAAFCGYVPMLIVGVVSSVLLCLIIQHLGFR